MDARVRNRWAATVALVGGLLLLLTEPSISPRWQVALVGATAAACAAVAGVATARYRQQHDPLALLLAIAFGVLAVQAAIFGVWWPIAHEGEIAWTVTVGTAGTGYSLAVPTTRVSVEAWLVGLVVAGACAVVGNPWWDRRGRRPIRPWLALALAAATTAVADAIVVVAAREPGARGAIAYGDLRPGAPWSVDAGGPSIVLGAAAAVLFGVALWQELFGRRTRAHVWWGVTFAAGATLALAQAQDPTFGLPTVRWADALALVVPATALIGLLASQSADATRMRRATDRAEEVLAGRAEIAAMVAHDVRGPLGTMKGLATTIRKSYGQLRDEERLEFIGMIERESSRLLALVDHIALALKVDARTLDVDLRLQQLAPLVRRAVEEHDLPPHPMNVDVPEDLRARLDAKWFPVALSEALSNAAKYSPDEGPIAVTARATEGAIVVAVVDRGPGVPPERRDEVFQRFSRWRPPGYEDRPGSGLGLFICRGILLEHGGSASLADGPDGGTICRIELPTEGSLRG